MASLAENIFNSIKNEDNETSYRLIREIMQVLSKSFIKEDLDRKPYNLDEKIINILFYGYTGYKVNASLPFFIPFPYLIGTFGAFVSLRDPVPTRKAMAEIGGGQPPGNQL